MDISAVEKFAEISYINSIKNWKTQAENDIIIIDY